MTLFQVLQTIGLPCAYSYFQKEDEQPASPPYLLYTGGGQDTFKGDDTYIHQANHYQVEYYFTKKDEEMEATIEQALLNNGYLYEKSEDTYIESEGVFVIYYQI